VLIGPLQKAEINVTLGKNPLL